jgi:predicted ATPase
MLKKLSVKNYKCFENFEFTFEEDSRSILLLGKNGSGKTTFADVLEVFQRIARGEVRIGRLVPWNPDGRRGEQGDYYWFATGANRPVEFALSVQIEQDEFRYAFSLEPVEGFRELRILTEDLYQNDTPIYTRKGAQIKFENNKDAEFSYDWHVLFLPNYQARLNDGIREFRLWMQNILVLAPVPSKISASSAESEQNGTIGRPYLTRDCANAVSWVRYLFGRRPSIYGEVEKYLKNIWDDFKTLVNEDDNTAIKSHLKIEFEDAERLSLSLDKFSDGEKCFFISAVVIATMKDFPQTLCFWDEPNNYLALPEIQHFAQNLRLNFQKTGQLIATSHDAELINSFPESSIWVIRRENHLSPTQPPERVADMRKEGKIDGKEGLIHAIINGGLL